MVSQVVSYITKYMHCDVTSMNNILSFKDVHSLHRRCAATQGNSYPKNIQFLMVDDIMVYYYISAGKEPSIPKWLNHSEGIFLWGEIRRNLNYNRFIMDTAVRLTSERFNHSHGKILIIGGSNFGQAMPM